MLRSVGRAARLRAPALQFCRGMFIQTEVTPNPESLKFLPGKAVLESGAREFRSFREAQASPLAKKLLQMEGVTSVFLATDFVTVSKAVDADWLTLKPLIFASLMDFYAADEPVLAADDDDVDSLAIQDDDSEVVQMIKELLELRIRPSVQDDGGDIVFRGFDEEEGMLARVVGAAAGVVLRTRGSGRTEYGWA